MMVSRRARFATHGLLYLAKFESPQPISFRRILDYLESWSLELSLSSGYVAKIFQDLSRSGLVRSVAGRSGGYLLARPADQIPVLDVLRAIDGISDDDDCCFLALGQCAMQDHCGVTKVMAAARQAFCGVLEGENLASLATKMVLPKGHSSEVPDTTPGGS